MTMNKGNCIIHIQSKNSHLLNISSLSVQSLVQSQFFCGGYRPRHVTSPGAVDSSPSVQLSPVQRTTTPPRFPLREGLPPRGAENHTSLGKVPARTDPCERLSFLKRGPPWVGRSPPPAASESSGGGACASFGLGAVSVLRVTCILLSSGSSLRGPLV